MRPEMSYELCSDPSPSQVHGPLGPSGYTQLPSSPLKVLHLTVYLGPRKVSLYVNWFDHRVNGLRIHARTLVLVVNPASTFPRASSQDRLQWTLCCYCRTVGTVAETQTSRPFVSVPRAVSLSTLGDLCYSRRTQHCSSFKYFGSHSNTVQKLITCCESK